MRLAKEILANLIKESNYYVTHNGQDAAYTKTLHTAKTIGESLTKGDIKIEVYYGKNHGDGGALRYSLKYDHKSKKWVKQT